MLKNKFISLFLFLIVTFTASFTGGILTIKFKDPWYALLNKPFFNPPDWIFAPVWTILYFLMALAIWNIWMKSNKLNLVYLYFIHLIFNTTWSIVFFGFKNIELAISFLEANKIKILKKSSYYESLSYPDRKKPKFINIIIKVETILPPKDLMNILISIEEKLERKRKNKNDPRTCDLDIIDYNNKIMDLHLDENKLTIPHKNLSKRDFVLYPLREICPNWVHPISKKKIDDLIKDLKNLNNDITKLSQNDIMSYVK